MARLEITTPRPWYLAGTTWMGLEGEVLAEAAPDLRGWGGWQLIDGTLPQPAPDAVRAPVGWYSDDTEGYVVVSARGYRYAEHRS